MGKLMISCQRAGELIEKKNAGELSFVESLQLHAHKAMCDACRLYEKQSEMIDNLLKSKAVKDDFTDEEVGRVKERILKKNSDK